MSEAGERETYLLALKCAKPVFLDELTEVAEILVRGLGCSGWIFWSTRNGCGSVN